MGVQTFPATLSNGGTAMHTREDEELAEEFLSIDRKHQTFYKQVTEPGLVVGLFSGAAMALVWMVLTGIFRHDFFEPMRLVASGAWGYSATEGSTGAVALGVVVHLLVAAAYGVIYAALARKLPASKGVFAGLLYGFVVYLFMRYAIIPWVAPPLVTRVTPWILLVSHLVYGLLLGVSLPMRRSVRRENARRRLPA
jgi:hypothetical protein